MLQFITGNKGKLTEAEIKGQGKFEYSPRCGAMKKLKNYLLKK